MILKNVYESYLKKSLCEMKKLYTKGHEPFLVFEHIIKKEMILDKPISVRCTVKNYQYHRSMKDIMI